MSTGRMRRVDEAIRQVIGDAVAGDLKDPRVGFVTVTDVRTSADLRHARVYVSVLGRGRAPRAGAARGQPRRAAERARLPAGRASAAELRLKRTPTLEFFYDDTTDRAMRVDALIDEIGASDERQPTRTAWTRASRCSRGCARTRASCSPRTSTPTATRSARWSAMQGLLGARQGLGDVHLPDDLPLPVRVPIFPLEGPDPGAPGRHRRAHGRVPRLRQHRPQFGERAARRRAPAEHRSSSRQHPLRHRQLRRSPRPRVRRRSSGT